MPGLTLSILARTCGVSPATVSRALAGHPHVRPEVRERVLAAARSQGYQRSHLVSAIMGRVRAARTQSFVGNLAIVHVASPKQPEVNPMQRRMVRAAGERAIELGFRVELFNLGDQGVSAAGLGRMLRARGVLGVIFLQPDSNNVTDGFPWEYFACLQIDYDSPHLLHHTISLDHHFTLIAALERLHVLGYRRIGLFIERHKDERLVYKWSAAFRAVQQNHRDIGVLPRLKADVMQIKDFLAWRKEHEPDLVIGHVDRALVWLKKAGLRVPEDIGFFNLNWNERMRPCAGLDLRPELHGVVAVETLAAQIQRNERGLPEDPRTVSILGRWVDGPTLRVVTGS